MPRIFPSTTDEIARAAELLRAGDIIAFPTETVYGLGADLFSQRAIEKIFKLKKRPADNPLIAHVGDAQQAREIVAAEWDQRSDALAERFWPGPLTVVVSKRNKVPAMATAGLETVAIRAPRHAAARELLAVFGGPIGAPSANRSGHVSPTRAEHVAHDFADVADLTILDGGPCEVGIESTVLDMTAEPPRILRPGSVTAEMLRDVLGEVDSREVDAQTASPGTSPRHYAPHAAVALVDRAELETRLAASQNRIAVLFLGSAADLSAERHTVITMPEQDERYAASLYDALRRADDSGAKEILIETPPEDSDLWRSIHNRLRRAARKS